MREIKFRGKRVDNGEWVYGSLMVGFTGINYIIVMHDHILSMTEMYEVNPETVGQFTGLKDKNGKEIYEGDIVKSVFNHKDTNKTDVAVVEYDTINPCFVLAYKYNGNGHFCYEYDFVQCGLRYNEIIGNLHENPDLLK